tara:strand:+ start:93343 stop:94950 length:1608 start_codon:yes stop_codon:yes gene_type:complete
MQNFKFEGLGNNVKIKSLGPLFRKIDGPRWGVNVGFYSKQEKSSLTMSNAHVLVINGVLNPTKGHDATGWKDYFRIKSTQQWDTKESKECPAIERLSGIDASQNCFVFKIEDGKTVYLPQFELARALFFHDSYLSRTAIESDCLAAEFDVRVVQEARKAIINVMPSSGYPLKKFNDPGCRRMLSWVLLDPDARSSYESIGKYQKLKGYEVGLYRHWNFQFDPPALCGAQLSVRGKFDPKTNCLFVFEIYAIHNLKADIPEVVEIYHPDFTESVQGAGAGACAIIEQPSEGYMVHDGGDANMNNQSTIIQSSSLDIEFNKAFKTSKVAAKQKQSSSGKLDDALSDGTLTAVSTEEASGGQGLPSADWNNVNDITDDAHLYENKFTCFRKMIDLIVAKDGCTIKSEQIRKLPKLRGYSKHLLSTDANPRCVAVIEMTVRNKTIHILEVDTSDADKSLSTQVIKIKNPDNWDNDLKELEKQLIKSSLCWPTKTLTWVAGKGQFRGMSHPKTDSKNKGVLSSDSIANWADRLYARISTF